MYKKTAHVIGWLTLIILGLLWVLKGYLSIYLILIIIAYIAFSISDGSIKKLRKLKHITVAQVIFIIISFIFSVAIVLGLIQLSKYIIDHILALSGWLKIGSQILAIFLSLYPVKFTLGSVLLKVGEDLNARDET